MEMYVKKTQLTPQRPHYEHGWGNGYVFLTFSHPWWGLGTWNSYKEDDHFHKEVTLNVHGGITFEQTVDGDDWIPGSHWAFGFDTAHYGDNLRNWPKERVELETKELFCQLMEIEMGEL